MVEATPFGLRLSALGRTIVKFSNGMKTWQCIRGCGACCYLDPSERPDLEEYLSPEELQQYFSMVGHDGWCVNYDRVGKTCRIYPDRPRFCRVEPESFGEMFGIEPEELNEFAIECCREHISDIYGDNSWEMVRFESAIANGDAHGSE